MTLHPNFINNPARTTAETMKIFLVTLGLVGAALSMPLDVEWAQWKQLHGKTYTDENEHRSRMAWLQNYHYIQKHNSEDHLFKLGLNEYADMSHEEFQQVYLQQHLNYAHLDEDADIHAITVNVTSPSSLDWRSKGFVSRVKNQGRCSSSWAFSAAGVLEGQMYKRTRTLVSLSEQQLLDCSGSYGNKGCYGGVPSNAFKYVHEKGGICSEASYPYLGYVYYCADSHCSKVTSTGSKTTHIQSGCENCLVDATYYIGPISVAVDASSISFQYYTSGIYYDNDCNRSNLNHAMLVVGYGKDSTSALEYWILKNSWGDSWGIKGYMLMARNYNNMCGVATAASYTTS